MPDFLLGDLKMVASSVTGVGPGDSNGKYKPQNGCGCGGGCGSGNSGNISVQSSNVKKSCYSRYNYCNVNKINIGNGNSIKVC